MKTLIALFLAGVSCVSLASERIAAQNEQPSVEPYTYSTHLDIAKVIAHSQDVSQSCGVVPVQMTYEDHQGRLHTVQYQAIGNGCAH